MTNKSPSTAQWEVFLRAAHFRPVVLIYRYHAPSAQAAERALQELSRLAAQHKGALRWAGQEQQVLIGPVPQFGRVAFVHFANRKQAQAHCTDAAHQRFAAPLKTLEITVIGEQPEAIARISRLFAWLMPKLPLPKKGEPGPEPFAGSSVMPTDAAYADFYAHPEQDTPVVMLNWLKFKQKAAYQSYGKVALVAAHSLGSKLLHVGRYYQVLVGNDGDPATDAWHECAAMQYPSRKAFVQMASLAYYRRALADRYAGLAEFGQGLIAAKPDLAYVWRK